MLHSALTLDSLNSRWNKTLSRLPQLAQFDYPLLLLGESGTGKDVLAQQIHRLSKRRAQNFVSVNCAAIQDTLVESELFGHRKGSFTGAESHRPGAFLSANQGTLFLDEIGDLPLGLQAKLLRALENREIKAVGSDLPVRIDVRVIAATHKNLRDQVNKGHFREDLYYRLNVLSIEVPALRDRSEDIATFVRLFSKDHNLDITEQGLALLQGHSWPGNIRELRNFIMRAAANFPMKRIGATEVFEIMNDASRISTKAPKGTREFLREYEKSLIEERLHANNWNQRRTAREMGIPKSTLNDHIKRYGLGPDKVPSVGGDDSVQIHIHDPSLVQGRVEVVPDSALQT